MSTTTTGLPHKQGMYDPAREHDACGVGFIANIRNEKSHDIVQKGLEILIRLTHRGASGADPREGDGAGILTQLPHDFFAAKSSELAINLPESGHYGIGMIFFPREAEHRDTCKTIIEQTIVEDGNIVLGWRAVPVNAVRAD
ncbi:MAG: hypothetical protein R8K53_06910, partial [Mariprofundaceae bacterium]